MYVCDCYMFYITTVFFWIIFCTLVISARFLQLDASEYLFMRQQLSFFDVTAISVINRVVGHTNISCFVAVSSGHSENCKFKVFSCMYTIKDYLMVTDMTSLAINMLAEFCLGNVSKSMLIRYQTLN